METNLECNFTYHSSVFYSCNSPLFDRTHRISLFKTLLFNQFFIKTYSLIMLASPQYDFIWFSHFSENGKINFKK